MKPHLMFFLIGHLINGLQQAVKSQDHTSSFGSSAYKVHKNTMGAMYTPICTHSLVMMMLTYFIIILYYSTYQHIVKYIAICRNLTISLKHIHCQAIKTLMISNDFPYNVENMKQIKSHKTNFDKL